MLTPVVTTPASGAVLTPVVPTPAAVIADPTTTTALPAITYQTVPVAATPGAALSAPVSASRSRAHCAVMAAFSH